MTTKTFTCEQCGEVLESANSPHTYEDCQRRMPILAERDALRAEVNDFAKRVVEQDEEIVRLRAALEQILTDPDARILDSHRDDAWEALDRHKPR